MEADGWEVEELVEELVEAVEELVEDMTEKREVVVVDGVVVVVVGAQVDTMEKEQMGMRRKNNWEAGRKTILEADDESDLKQILESFIGLR